MLQMPRPRRRCPASPAAWLYTLPISRPLTAQAAHISQHVCLQIISMRIRGCRCSVQGHEQQLAGRIVAGAGVQGGKRAAAYAGRKQRALLPPLALFFSHCPLAAQSAQLLFLSCAM